MKYQKFDTQAYRNAAQDQFSGADGWENFNQEPAFNADGGPAMNADGPQLVDAPELDFTIVNTSTTVSATCVLFGGSLYLTGGGTFGSGATITVTPAYGVGYTQILQDSINNPFTVGMIRMQSTNTSQVTQGISIVSTNIYGATATDPLNMVTAISEYQYQNTIARSTRAFDVTGDVYISFPVLASTTVICSIYSKKKVNIARALNGVPSLGVYGAPNMGIRPLVTNTGSGSSIIAKLGK